MKDHFFNLMMIGLLLSVGLCGLCALHLPIRVQPGPSVAFRLRSEIASLKATGQAALGAITRLMGLVLAVIGVQMLIEGITGAIALAAAK